MKLQKPNSSSFEAAPEGTAQAVVVDVVDLGMAEDRFNPGEMIQQLRVAFQTEEETSDGKPFLVSTYPVKASLNSKSNLVKTIIKPLIGRDLVAEDYDAEGDVDLDALLIGVNANVTIKHNEKGDRVYANVVDVSPLTKGQLKAEQLVPRDYVRMQDREELPTTTGTED